MGRSARTGGETGRMLLREPNPPMPRRTVSGLPIAHAGRANARRRRTLLNPFRFKPIKGYAMRPGQNNNKQRMRGRPSNNRRGPNPLTRSYESNGPDVKIRGNAHHVAEKYLQLARDAHTGGDPVAAENYLQHAEHYFRLIATAQAAHRPRRRTALRALLTTRKIYESRTRTISAACPTASLRPPSALLRNPMPRRRSPISSSRNAAGPCNRRPALCRSQPGENDRLPSPIAAPTSKPRQDRQNNDRQNNRNQDRGPRPERRSKVSRAVTGGRRASSVLTGGAPARRPEWRGGAVAPGFPHSSPPRRASSDLRRRAAAAARADRRAHRRGEPAVEVAARTPRRRPRVVFPAVAVAAGCARRTASMPAIPRRAATPRL